MSFTIFPYCLLSGQSNILASYQPHCIANFSAENSQKCFFSNYKISCGSRRRDPSGNWCWLGPGNWSAVVGCRAVRGSPVLILAQLALLEFSFIQQHIELQPQWLLFRHCVTAFCCALNLLFPPSLFPLLCAWFYIFALGITWKRCVRRVKIFKYKYLSLEVRNFMYENVVEKIMT